MAARTSEFQTIRSEGGLLPPDLLRRVLDPKERLVGTAAADYGLPEGERLNEVITQSWNRLRKHWQEFRAAASKLPPTEPGTGLTNDKWALPLLRELGYCARARRARTRTGCPGWVRLPNRAAGSVRAEDRRDQLSKDPSGVRKARLADFL